MAQKPNKRRTGSSTTRKVAARPTRLARLRHHAVASLLGVAPHPHTGKRIHHRHTSHGFLFLSLLLTGILLFSNLGALRAFSATKAGSVNISVNVLGKPPTEGATITFPHTNSTTSHKLVTVTGTCPEQTLVVIYNSAVFAGSTICSQGEFQLTVTLKDGTNILQAQNYDGLEQPGPATAAVIVVKEVESVNPAVPGSVETPETPTPATTIAEVVPQTEPVVTPEPVVPLVPDACAELDETPLNSSTPNIAVGCVQRNVFAGETIKLPLLIKGGLAPFALSVDWGDEHQDLVTVLDNKKKVLAHTYETGGFHEIKMKATDSSGSSTQLQTTVSVNGESITSPVVTGVGKIIETAKSVWVEAPVPMYFAAVALAVGFWVGDIFQRFAMEPPIRRRTAHRHS